MKQIRKMTPLNMKLQPKRLERIPLLLTVCFVVLQILPGCGKGKAAHESGNIEGVITLKGEPLKSGYIQFLSISSSDAGLAHVKEDGSYQVKALSLGEYRVQIGPPIVPPGTPAPAASGQTIPKKYTTPSTSGLQTVIKPGKNEFNVTLD